MLITDDAVTPAATWKMWLEIHSLIHWWKPGAGEELNEVQGVVRNLVRLDNRE